MSFPEEELFFNDKYLSSILNPDNSIREEANKQIMARIKEDPDYIIILAEYSLLRINNIVIFKLSLIVICKIIISYPIYLFQNYDSFQSQLLSLLNAIKTIPGAYEQRIFANIINNTIMQIANQNNQNLPENDLAFYEHLYNEFLTEVTTLPLAFFVNVLYRFSPRMNKVYYIHVIRRIIIEYYPISLDFELLVGCIRLFCLITSKSDDFNEDSEVIFALIIDFASNSSSLNQAQFSSFWIAIQDINVNRVGPLCVMAINLMKSIQDSEVHTPLLNFIERHISTILPDQVQFLLDYFFNSIITSIGINQSDFSFLSAVSIFGEEVFNYIYNLSLQIFAKNTLQSYKIYLLVIITLIESSGGLLAKYIDDVIDNCMNLCLFSIQNNLIDIIDLILMIFTESMVSYNNNPKVNEIPIFLLDIIEKIELPEYVIALFKPIVIHVPSLIDHFAFFDRLLFLLVSQISNISDKLASYFLLALSLYLPSGRLFPEDKFKPIYDVINYYTPTLDIKAQKLIRYPLSILIFKMFLIDQESYIALLDPIFINLTNAISYDKSLDESTLNECSNQLMTFIKIFGEVALQKFSQIDFAGIIFQTIFNVEKFSYTNPYMNILAYICKYNNDVFKERKSFVKNIIRGILTKKDLELQNIVKFADKFLYLALNPEYLKYIRKYLLDFIKNSIQNVDTLNLDSYISLYSTFIKPSHVMKRTTPDREEYLQFVKQLVDDLVETAKYLIPISVTNKNQFRNFYDSIVNILIILCPYECEIIHAFYSIFYQQFNLDQENCDISQMIPEVETFFLFGTAMMKHKIINKNEIMMMTLLYQKILLDQSLYFKYADTYISMSHLILINPEYLRPFMNILYNHWKIIDNEYTIHILCTLFLMIFARLPNCFDQSLVFSLSIEISDRFVPTTENCNYFIQSSIEFLTNYPEIPDVVVEHFFRSFIIYLSYQKYAYYLFNVKLNNHNNLIEFIQKMIPRIPNWKEIFESCFPGSPRALKGALDMINTPNS